MTRSLEDPQEFARRAKEAGLHRRDIKPCTLCGKGIGHDQNLISYRFTIETHVLDTDAVRRTHGFELMVGNPMLAAVLGDDETLTALLSKRTHLVCQDCTVKHRLIDLIEREGDQPEGHHD